MIACDMAAGLWACTAASQRVLQATSWQESFAPVIYTQNDLVYGRRFGRRRGVDRQKLIIILVGLPGRGKTFLCNKLMCYLNWLGASPTAT